MSKETYIKQSKENQKRFSDALQKLTDWVRSGAPDKVLTDDDLHEVGLAVRFVYSELGGAIYASFPVDVINDAIDYNEGYKLTIEQAEQVCADLHNSEWLADEYWSLERSSIKEQLGK